MKPDSATCARSWEKGLDYVVSLNKDHFDLVKYTEADRDYELVRDYLRKFIESAIPVIRARRKLLLG